MSTVASRDATGRFLPAASHSGSCPKVNVGPQERAYSAAAGTALILFGLTRGPFRGFLTSMLGAGLLYRGVSGHCDVYKAMDVDTANQS